MRKLLNSQLDARFNGAKRSLRQRGDLTLALLLEECQANDLLLCRGQTDEMLS